MMSPRAVRWVRRMFAVLVPLGAVGGVFANCENIPATRGWLDNIRGGVPLPAFSRIERTLGLGTHPYLSVLPGAPQVPSLFLLDDDPAHRKDILDHARIRIALTPDYAHIDDKAGVIVLSWWYYHLGTDVDLYLDLLHEVTHLRQLAQGKDLWDASLSYVDRPTEIEGYAVAVTEGRRLGLPAPRLREHLHNPWMTDADVDRLLVSIDTLVSSRTAPH